MVVLMWTLQRYRKQTATAAVCEALDLLSVVSLYLKHLLLRLLLQHQCAAAGSPVAPTLQRTALLVTRAACLHLTRRQRVRVRARESGPRVCQFGHRLHPLLGVAAVPPLTPLVAAVTVIPLLLLLQTALKAV